MPGSCLVCDSEAKFRCGVCRNVWYCNTECQRSNWKKHKLVCKKPAEVDDSKRHIIDIVIVDGSKATRQRIDASDIDRSWRNCIVPHMCGIPIKYKCLAKHPERLEREVSIFLLVDPVSGLAAPEWQINCGIMAFALENTDFSVDLFWDVYSYMYHLMDFYGESDFNYESFRQSNLNNLAFRQYQENEHEIQRQYRAHFV